MEREQWKLSKDLFRELMNFVEFQVVCGYYHDQYPHLLDRITSDLADIHKDAQKVLSPFMYRSAWEIGKLKGEIQIEKSIHYPHTLTNYRLAEADWKAVLDLQE